jgi:hypothetical protein
MCQHAKDQITFNNFGMTYVLIVRLFGVLLVNVPYFFSVRMVKVRDILSLNYGKNNTL